VGSSSVVPDGLGDACHERILDLSILTLNETPPSSLTRADLDRVIRRAIELQLRQDEPGSGTPTGGEPGSDTLSVDEVLRIGRDVGIAEAHMQRALGEVRAAALTPALPPDEGLARRLFGEGRVRVERAVSGSPAAVEERVTTWLDTVESLHCVRRRSGVSLWEPAEGLVAQLQRALKWGGQRYDLARARRVELSVQGLEEGYALVVVTADLRNVRAEQGGVLSVALGLAGAVALGVATVGAVGSGVLVLPPVAAGAGALAGAAAGGVGGVLLGRGQLAKEIERVRLGAEGLLDRLERDELDLPDRWPRNFHAPRR